VITLEIGSSELQTLKTWVQTLFALVSRVLKEPLPKNKFW